MVIKSMVIQDVLKEEKEILKERIKELEKEISILHSLGVEDYEIKYLVSMKRKRELALSWEQNQI